MVDLTEDLITAKGLTSKVGLVGLATAVTRSSIASLQAKQGLPLGTQLMGWTVLGKC